MMRKIFLAIAFALCATQAQAALVVTPLGKAQGIPNGSNQIVLTTVADCPVGSLIVLFDGGATAVANNLSSIADSASNSYAAPFDGHVNAAAFANLIWANAINTAHDLPLGGTITSTYANNSTNHSFLAICITGAATASPLDISAKTANGAGVAATSATTVNSGTLGQANEVVLAGEAFGGNSGTVTCGGAYTKYETQVSGSTGIATLCGQVVASTASVAFSPTWGTSQTWITDLISFKGVAVGAGNTSALTTVGVSQ